MQSFVSYVQQQCLLHCKGASRLYDNSKVDLNSHTNYNTYSHLLTFLHIGKMYVETICSLYFLLCALN